mmetsp:Transcript_5398/g.5884  ORF Transcript_5398/g.5884 Transcript_5398/m.5884 type:complete len:235 (-) Transcript_5398:150-854(-)
MAEVDVKRPRRRKVALEGDMRTKSKKTNKRQKKLNVATANNKRGTKSPGKELRRSHSAKHIPRIRRNATKGQRSRKKKIKNRNNESKSNGNKRQNSDSSESSQSRKGTMRSLEAPEIMRRPRSAGLSEHHRERTAPTFSEFNNLSMLAKSINVADLVFEPATDSSSATEQDYEARSLCSMSGSGRFLLTADSSSDEIEKPFLYSLIDSVSSVEDITSFELSDSFDLSSGDDTNW